MAIVAIAMAAAHACHPAPREPLLVRPGAGGAYRAVFSGVAILVLLLNLDAARTPVFRCCDAGSLARKMPGTGVNASWRPLATGRLKTAHGLS